MTAALLAYDRLAARVFDAELAPRPGAFNIGALVDEWAAVTPQAPAVIFGERGDQHLDYATLSGASGRLAAALAARGVGRGDRVAISLPQGPDCAISQAATLKLGAMSMPLSRLYGQTALATRIAAATPRVVICQARGAEQMHAACEDAGVEATIVVSGDSRQHDDLHGLIAEAGSPLPAVATDRDDPALLLFTSGTTGPPKGVVHAHRVVPGHAASLSLAHNLYPRAGSVLWSPADWSWAGGLVNCLFFAWQTGTAIGTYPDRPFDPELAVDLISASGATALFLPPTALRRLRATLREPVRRRTRIASIMSGSEALDADLCEWCVEFLGVPPNEVYGQTEASAVVGNCTLLLPLRPGSIGQPYPGAEIALLDDDGAPVGVGDEGEIAVGRGAASVFLEYWQDHAGTAAKFSGDWMRTGDLGAFDEDGYLWFRARRDDLIVSAGYRIGPSEIEACLCRDPAVMDAAVIGLPDPDRGHQVAAYIELREGALGDVDVLRARLTEAVSSELAPFQRPRVIEVVDRLPRTTTGKVRRAELRALVTADPPG